MTWSMVLLALALALDIFDGGISLGLQGLPRAQWARSAALFATVAFFMLVAGVLLGRSLGDRLGSHATYFAGVLLLLVGLQAMFEAVQEHEIEDLGAISGFSFKALLGIFAGHLYGQVCGGSESGRFGAVTHRFPGLSAGADLRGDDG